MITRMPARLIPEMVRKMELHGSMGASHPAQRREERYEPEGDCSENWLSVLEKE